MSVSQNETAATLLPPGGVHRLGLIGEEHAARMVAAAGYRFGYDVRLLSVGDGEGEPEASFDALAREVDLLVYVSPTLPAAWLEGLRQRSAVSPGLETLRMGRDRYEQRLLLERQDIPTYPIFPIVSRESLHRAFARFGGAAVLKERVRTEGRSSAAISTHQDLDASWFLMGGHELVLEPMLSIRRELLLLSVRSRSGEIAHYPLMERGADPHDLWIAPAPDITPLQTEAATYAGRLLRALNHVGVLATTFYQTDRRLLAAEFQPGIHRGGAWTADGARTSLYENHLRAVLGLPLGPVGARDVYATFPLACSEEYAREFLETPGVHVQARRTPQGYDLQVTLAAEHHDSLWPQLRRLHGDIGRLGNPGWRRCSTVSASGENLGEAS